MPENWLIQIRESKKFKREDVLIADRKKEFFSSSSRLPLFWNASLGLKERKADLRKDEWLLKVGDMQSCKLCKTFKWVQLNLINHFINNHIFYTVFIFPSLYVLENGFLLEWQLLEGAKMWWKWNKKLCDNKKRMEILMYAVYGHKSRHTVGMIPQELPMHQVTAHCGDDSSDTVCHQEVITPQWM